MTIDSSLMPKKFIFFIIKFFQDFYVKICNVIWIVMDMDNVLMVYANVIKDGKVKDAIKRFAPRIVDKMEYVKREFVNVIKILLEKCVTS